MLPTSDAAARSPRHTTGRTAALAAALLTLLCAASNARAQSTFSSGSTGADGAFAPTANQTVAVPDGGVFNFTTVNIPSNVTVRFLRNSKNTPVTILASGDVTIAGSIVVDAGAAPGSGAGQGGPGGFDGGMGGNPTGITNNGDTGEGPGGGTGGFGNQGNGCPLGGGGGGFGGAGAVGEGGSAAGGGAGGPRYGSSALVPLIGGSGGGGGSTYQSTAGGGGGGGGGAILIASSGDISLSGLVSARGSNGGTGAAGGGGGAGGAIRLVANAVRGSGQLLAPGGTTGGVQVCNVGGAGAPGYLRVEAHDYGSFRPNTNPSFVSFALPHAVAPTNVPVLRIVSVAGVAAPAAPTGSMHAAPDVVVPTTQPNPVTVALEGANVPVGTLVTVTLTPQQGQRSSAQSTPLSGSDAASTATASIALPAGMSVLTATAVIDLTTQASSGRPLFIDGERVDRVEVAATYGGASQVTYVTRSGRRLRRPSE
jgi:hypothetical protein